MRLYLFGALALVSLGVGIYDLVAGQWGWAVLNLALAAGWAWAAQPWRSPYASGGTFPAHAPKGNERLPDRDFLTWEDHTRDCRICKERGL
ncbi:hypothetical protein [Streptomyces sp. S1]|uniref:hypothetical protein n=1 Tax=Streptomyces sp. S1 TaxID=718288 RepID=UPI003D749E02